MTWWVPFLLRLDTVTWNGERGWEETRDPIGRNHGLKGNDPRVEVPLIRNARLSKADKGKRNPMEKKLGGWKADDGAAATMARATRANATISWRRCGAARRSVARASGKKVMASADTEKALREAEAMAVAGLPDGAVCDDFECTVSPACELTTKQISRSLVKKENEASIVAKDVEYKNPYVSFSGKEKYAAFNYWKDEMGGGKVRVRKMSMAKEDVACIEWTIEDQSRAGNIVVDVTSLFTLNLISGRVLKREDTFRLDSCPAQTRALFVSSMSAYSLRTRAKDVADAAKRISQSFSSFDESDEEYFADPRDPNKFFQQQDNTLSDAFQLATLIAAIYAVVKVLEQIETLK